MKKSLLLLLMFLCLVSTNAFAQQSQLLEVYQSHVNRLDTWAQKRGDYNREDSLDAINQSLIQFLVEKSLLLNEDISIPNGKGGIITTSEDKKVRIYSWDDRKGAEMRFPRSVIQYEGKSGIRAATLCRDSTKDFLCPFYLEVHNVATTIDTFYVVIGHAIGSSKHGAFMIEAFKIEGDTLNWDVKAFETKTEVVSSIAYDYDVTWEGPNPTEKHPVIVTDWPAKTFRIPQFDKKDRITGKYLVYAFNGQRFKFQRVE